MQLTRNFSAEEFYCPCHRCANKSGALISMTLVVGLQDLRETLKRPVAITSGYRCKEHNQEIGGETNSLHTQGRAADIHVPGISSLTELYEAVLTVPVFVSSGIGIYPQEDFIHVDVKRVKPGRWARVGGKYVAIEQGLKLLEKKETVV